MNTIVYCPSCKGGFAEGSNITHPYMESSPGCWETFGRVLEREYSNRSFFEGDCIHKLTIDTYAAQHPGRPSAQSIKSVGYHLTRMCLILGKGISPHETQQCMVRISQKKDQFFWLPPPSDLGPMTIKDVAETTTVSEHKKMVELWAKHVWEAWREHHPVVHRWLDTTFAI